MFCGTVPGLINLAFWAKVTKAASVGSPILYQVGCSESGSCTLALLDINPHSMSGFKAISSD